MDKQLYTEFIKVFANTIQANGDIIADIVDCDYYSPLYEYYHSHFHCETLESENAMWGKFWADFNKAFTTFFKDYIQ